MNDSSCKVDCKRCLLTMAAVFVAVTLSGFVFNHLLMGSTYEAHAGLWRAPEETKKLMPLLFLGYAVFSWFFVSIYARGYEEGKPPMGQALRYALLLWPVA